MKPKFWSLAEMKQPVNQWLCIAFFSVLGFWLVLYYVTQKAEAIGNNFGQSASLSSFKN